MKLTAALCCSLSSFTAPAQDPPPAVPASPSSMPAAVRGEIAFARAGAIVLLDVATGAETVLVEDNRYERPLTWLPDGEQLLYWNHDGGAWDLWTVAVKSKARTNLTRSARDNRSPAPAPDGRTIAFHRGGDGVWLMVADGSGQHQLDPRGHRDLAPCWSTDGNRLAFTDLQPAAENRVRIAMHVLTLADGKVVTRRELGDGDACAFLDEHHLLATGPHDGAIEVLIVDTRDGSRRALTRSADRDHDPVLSPDRQRIVWIVSRDPVSRLMSMRIDGSEMHDLAPMQHAFAPPSVSPDGQFVVFESGEERSSRQLHLVRIRGGDLRPLTSKGGSHAVWRPRR